MALQAVLRTQQKQASKLYSTTRVVQGRDDEQ